jgi:hypothetical protein
MNPMRLAFAVLIMVCLAACERRAATYPPGYETNFMTACEAQPGAIAERCACIWDRIEAEIDPDDLSALELLPGPERQTHPLMQQIEGYRQACLAAFPVEAPGEPTPAP